MVRSKTMQTGGKRLKRHSDVDMTQGSIARHIISFALPLLLGNLFQQLYNMVDTWVVGNYVSNDAFAAVGAVTPTVNMLIGFFLGLSTGAGVVISQYYGAGNMEKVEKTVHTAIVLTVILSVVFTIVGVLITPVMLGILNLQANAGEEAATYLTIYFAGVTGLLFYNMGAAILRAVGDSRRPFYFLVACALTNTVLDLLFVLKFNMGVAGVAWATIISQGVSGVLVIIALLRSDTCVKLRIKKLSIDWAVMKKILYIGLPAALQMSITALSNVFVQSYISHFDVGLASPDHMSAWTAYIKIDQFLVLPVQSIALACTTFVGQNLGKGLLDRAKQGVKKTFLINTVTLVIIMIPVVIFAPYLVGFFNSKPEVVELGTLFLRLFTPLYILFCYNHTYMNALRGAGNSRSTMVFMLSSFVLFRQVYLFAMSRICNELIPIIISYPLGWFVCSVLIFFYYRKVGLDKNTIGTLNKE